MQFTFLLKLFGKKIIAEELASILLHHTTTQGMLALVPIFQAGAAGCTAGDDAAVAGAITDLLFSIH